MKERIVISEIKAIKTYSDPYKQMILQTYYNLMRPATVKQVSDIMGEVPAKVYYHVKKLEEYGFLKLCYTRDINGIIAKYYEPTAKCFEIVNEALGQNAYVHIDTRVHSTGMSSIFDNHKIHCLSASQMPTAQDPFVFSSELFLSQKEYLDLVEYIRALNSKCQRKSGKKRAYKILTSISQMNSSEGV